MGIDSRETTRRDFVLAAAGTGAGLLLAGCAMSPTRPSTAEPASEPEQTVSPGEDLMREHAVLARVLLVYEEGVRRLDAQATVPVEVLAGAARLVRRFVEDYHEMLEEKYIFPRLEQAGRLGELVATLRQQHQAGRRLTEDVLRLATAAHMRGPGNRHRLANSLRFFIRMYRPHAAREDTVLLPAFRGLLGENEYDDLGAVFEERERTLLGQHGFDLTVNEVATLEKAIGTYDLARFTPS